MENIRIKEEVVLPLSAYLQRSVWITRQSERTCHLLPFNLCMPSARTNVYKFSFFNRTLRINGRPSILLISFSLYAVSPIALLALYQDFP